MKILFKESFVLSCLLACAAGAHAATTFTLISGPSGREATTIRSLSGNGGVAVGRISSSSTPTFTWSSDGGRVDIPSAATAGDLSYAYSVSRDGSSVVGYGGGFAYIRRTGIPDRQIFPYGSYGAVDAFGVNSDGNVLAMNLINGSTRTRVAFWTATSGYTVLPNVRTQENYAFPYAMSDDGNTIVGESGIQFGLNDPQEVNGAVWRRGGTVAPLLNLGGFAFSTQPYDVSADGSIVVGRSINSQGVSEACYWASPTQAIGLGVLSGFSFSLAMACDASGGIIGGASTAGPFSTAFIWTQELGMVSAATYLADRGVQIPAGWNLRDITAISADGLTFGGTASSATTPNTAFIATIPSGGLMLLPIWLSMTARRRR